MSVQIVQFRTDPERTAEVEEAIDKLFAAIDAASPAGIEYVASRVGDRPEYLLALTLPAEDAANPLLEIPEALALRALVGEWAGGPVPPVTLHVLGRYSG